MFVTTNTRQAPQAVRALPEMDRAMASTRRAASAPKNSSAQAANRVESPSPLNRVNQAARAKKPGHRW